METIAYSLNQHLKIRFQLSEDIVVISSLANQDGSVCSNVNNKIVLFITSIEKETSMVQASREISHSKYLMAKPIFINLYIMVSANFTGSNYGESLKFISSVIAFFQVNSVFNHQNHPDMNKGIDKIVLDIENVPIQDLSSIWGMLGAKYVPSILYKVRMITIDAKAEISRINEISEIDTITKQEGG
ncbi:DUF4255 domain-containing protein [Shewanella sp. NKUCC06_TVS]|uniref:DUF4255 domain-containing protein n=1 Tax=Shewanella sp. NKUCC06_TVS TaxID=2842128 RepID=UPI002035B30C|nr:DUF4255 domain-containing protein [Shewanella sp. NKUCC06_TVS]